MNKNNQSNSHVGGGNDMKKNVFVSKMKLYGFTNEALAKEIGLSPSRLSAKLNGWDNAQFTQGEISKLKDRLKLSDEEVIMIFF